MRDDLVHWAVLLHYVLWKVGDTQTETICNIQQVFGNDGVGVTQINQWFN